MPTSQPILTEERLYAMVDRELFAEGRRRSDRIGLELELVPVKECASGLPRAMRLRDQAGERGIVSWLRELGGRHDWDLTVDAYDNVTARTADGGAVTLEPAGQIEYSGSPFSRAEDALADLERFVDLLSTEGAPVGIALGARGYNDYCEGERELEVRKPRYVAMDAHFATIGPFGREMMRSTCALQINLDFGSASRAAERWRLANMVAPSLNAIFANSPFTIDGTPYRSFRYEIWRRLDPSRTGRLYDRPDLDPVADYLRFALDATVMMVEPEGGGTPLRPASPMTFRAWLEGDAVHGYPDWSDWRTHLSTLFPDVRARGYMEIRPIDALPREYRAVAVGFVDRLLRSDRLRAAALGRVESRERRRDPEVAEHGGYWRSDYETGRELFKLFIDDLPSHARAPYRRYLDELLSVDRVPADEALRLEGIEA